MSLKTILMNIFGDGSKLTQNQQIRQLLEQKLGFPGFYWYPLYGEPAAVPMEYFAADQFEQKFGTTKLQEILQEMGYSHLWLVDELGQDDQVTVKELAFYGSEVVFCGEDTTWAVYFSHENTVTLVGEPIITAVKNRWAGWEAYKNPLRL